MSNPAVSYEREMVPVLFGPWVASLLESAQPRRSDRVLDLACGTGIVARSVAQGLNGTGRVAGLDLNPAMLEVAGEASIKEGLQIDWHHGRAEALPFDAGSFDLVLCQQGLQFFVDQSAALVENRRVLAHGGRIGLSVWRGLDLHPFFAEFNDALVRRAGVGALAAPFALSDESELRALLANAGFTRISVEARSRTARFPNPRGFVAMEVDVIAAAIPSMQHYDTVKRAQLATALAGELEGPIRAATQDGELVIPFHAHIATAARD